MASHLYTAVSFAPMRSAAVNAVVTVRGSSRILGIATNPTANNSQNFTRNSGIVPKIENRAIGFRTPSNHVFLKDFCMAVESSLSLNASSSVNKNRRYFHRSSFCLKSIDDVHVTLEPGTSKSGNTNTNSNSAGKSTCSQGIPLEEEEDEQEEMFVVADPILGHGSIQEWGGPRRGGKLEEPTRFGDWERKGRCTDF